MAKKNNLEKILEQLATELANNTPGTPEYEKIFKHYIDIAQILETARTNTQKEKLETMRLAIDQQKANQDLVKIQNETRDREEDRKANEKLAELNRQASAEQAELNRQAEKLKSKYALWGSIGGAAIGAVGTIAVVGIANSSARKRTREVLHYEEYGTIASQGGKQTISNTLKPTKS